MPSRRDVSATEARDFATVDPTGFVDQNPDGLLVIDEVQRAPALIVSITAAVDRDKRPRRFLVTGSANLLDLTSTHESLAGRAESLVLHSFSPGELESRLPTVPTPARLASQGHPPAHAGSLAELRDRLGDRFAGGYVLYTGEPAHALVERITALPIDALWSLRPSVRIGRVSARTAGLLRLRRSSPAPPLPPQCAAATPTQRRGPRSPAGCATR